MFWDTPLRPMITHTSDSHQIPSKNKTKSKFQILKIAKNSNFGILPETLPATHHRKLFDNMHHMKWIQSELWSLQSGHGMRDRRTDRRTEWNQYTPQQLCCVGGIKKIQKALKNHQNKIYEQGVWRTTTPVSQGMNTLLLGPQIENCNNFALAHYLVHGHAYMGQTGEIQWHCITTSLDNFTDLWMAKIYPAVYEICILIHGKAHMDQMGKWTWCCTTTDLGNSTELWTKKISTVVSEICALAHRQAHIGQMGQMLYNCKSRQFHRA